MKVLILFVSSFLSQSVSASFNDEFTRHSERQISELIRTASTKVTALGRTADLGDLYDARTDSFVEISLYHGNFLRDGGTVHVTDSAYATMAYELNGTLSEKFNIMGVSASVAASFSIQIIEIGVGISGEFIKDDKESTSTAEASLVYSVRTVQEHLKIFSDKSRGMISNFLLENVEATHVVIGIEWGADVVLCLKETNTNEQNFQTIQGELQSSLKIFKTEWFLSAAANVGANWTEIDVEKSSTFSFKLFADIVPDMVPQTLNETIAFLRNIPQLIKKSNNGKGKIMNYIMMPLSTVQKVLNLETKLKGAVKDLDKALFDQFMQIFQEIKDSQLHINDVYNDMAKWILMISETDFGKISNLKSKFETYTMNLRMAFADRIVRFRDGQNLGNITLEHLIRSYQDSDFTPSKINELLANYTTILHKIRLLNLFEGYHALFINRRADKYSILTKNFQQEVRIVSVDLMINITSYYVREIVRLLQAKAMRYYIEDDPTAIVPNVKVYLEGILRNSFSISEREYVVLISQAGNGIVMDVNSYDQFTTFSVKKLVGNSFAIVNDMFYNIDTKAGHIEATNINNIIATPQDNLKWIRVGWFPKESYKVQSVAAVHNSIFYFITYNGVLYKYDTILKTVTKCTQDLPSGSTTYSSIIVEKTLYFYRNHTFYSYDGIRLKNLTQLEIRNSPGLFEFKGQVCKVGGESNNTKLPVACYDRTKRENWGILNFSNEIRRYPAVIQTKSGVMIFGGKDVDSSGADGNGLNSAEILNYDTKIWSYIPTPAAMNENIYSVFSLTF